MTGSVQVRYIRLQVTTAQQQNKFVNDVIKSVLSIYGKYSTHATKLQLNFKPYALGVEFRQADRCP